MALNTLCQRLRQSRVLVVGDAMLDRYWFSDVERISPEAPVPVARIRQTEERAGGAANVARNIAALGGQVHFLSVVGQDEAADQLEALLVRDGVRVSLHRDATISTTIKLRVLTRQQQLLRIDFEYEPHDEVLAAKLDAFCSLLSGADVVILSDYGKGGLRHVREMIHAARAVGKPVLIDPKGDDYECYRGATLLTPNCNEFRQVVGRWKDEDEFTRKAQVLRGQLELDTLLVTRSEEGMTLFNSEGTLHQPADIREVYDVSGAGDTVIGTLGLLIAAGFSLPIAMQWANRAAGITVSKQGTVVVTPEALFTSSDLTI